MTTSNKTRTFPNPGNSVVHVDLRAVVYMYRLYDIADFCSLIRACFVIKELQTEGVIAASAGNHALALSYHGMKLGIPVTVVMPIVAPLMKVQSCKQFGATVIIQGADIGEVSLIFAW